MNHTNITDILDMAELNRLSREGLVVERASECGNYSIFNYSKSAMYTKGAFESATLRECRGLIVDRNTGKVAARPFAKFFNEGEELAATFHPDEIVIVSDKIDGSLGIMFFNEYTSKWQIASRGSFVSEMAAKGTEMLQKYRHNPAVDGCTFMFEIVYPENRIVLDYGDMEELVLIGARDIKTGVVIQDWGVEMMLDWSGPVAASTKVIYSDVVESMNRPDREGVVITSLDGLRMAKRKEPEYVAKHRLTFGVSERNIWQAVLNGTADKLIASLPDDLRPWAAGVERGILDEASATLTSAYLAYRDIDKNMVGLYGSPEHRPAFASEVNKLNNPHLAKYLYAIFDKRSIWAMALKDAKPSPNGIR